MKSIKIVNIYLLFVQSKIKKIKNTYIRRYGCIKCVSKQGVM